MSSVATHHSKHVIDSIRRIYKPEVWLQIYYPLYYMAKAIRKHNDGRQCSVVEADNLLISLDIALLFIWTLWLHALWLIEILFIRRSARATPKWLSAASKFSNDQISVPLEVITVPSTNTWRHVNMYSYLASLRSFYEIGWMVRS